MDIGGHSIQLCGPKASIILNLVYAVICLYGIDYWILLCQTCFIKFINKIDLLFYFFNSFY